MTPDTERNEANAKIAHERRLRSALAVEAPIITFAVEALKAAILVNGGTAGALLAFVGQKGIQAQPGIGEAFYFFAFGLLFGALATAGSYVTQFCYSTAMNSYIGTWEHPYIENTSGYHWWRSAGFVFHFSSIILVALSFGTAIRGFLVAARALPF